MNLSSRWCFTAVVALGALSCSDPVPPPAQGAFIVTLSSVSPPPADGSTCPSGTSTTFDIPSERATMLIDALSTTTYKHWIVDGESDASVSCKVHGSSSFSFSGRIASGVQVLEITSGTLSNNMTGTARIAVTNSMKLSSQLVGDTADCTIKVVVNDKGPQVKAGSIWASFECPSLKHAPGEACGATGVFVLEDCTQ